LHLVVSCWRAASLFGAVPKWPGVEQSFLLETGFRQCRAEQMLERGGFVQNARSRVVFELCKTNL